MRPLFIVLFLAVMIAARPAAAQRGQDFAPTEDSRGVAESEPGVPGAGRHRSRAEGPLGREPAGYGPRLRAHRAADRRDCRGVGRDGAGRSARGGGARALPSRGLDVVSQQRRCAHAVGGIRRFRQRQQVPAGAVHQQHRAAGQSSPAVDRQRLVAPRRPPGDGRPSEAGNRVHGRRQLFGVAVRTDGDSRDVPLPRVADRCRRPARLHAGHRCLGRARVRRPSDHPGHGQPAPRTVAVRSRARCARVRSTRPGSTSPFRSEPHALTEDISFAGRGAPRWASAPSDASTKMRFPGRRTRSS